LTFFKKRVRGPPTKSTFLKIGKKVEPVFQKVPRILGRNLGRGERTYFGRSEEGNFGIWLHHALKPAIKISF